MTDDEYTIHWPRWQGCAGCLVGMALLYVLLDIHFFHQIPGPNPNAKHDVLINLFLGLFGLGFFFFGALTFLRPPALLSAGPSGITFFALTGRCTVDDGTWKPKWTRRRGDVCLVPWKKVTAIGKGTMYWIAIKGSGRHARHASALLIACDSAIQLDSYGSGERVSVGSGPGAPLELQEWPGSRIPGHESDSQFALNSMYIPGALDKTVARLLEMKRNYSS